MANTGPIRLKCKSYVRMLVTGQHVHVSSKKALKTARSARFEGRKRFLIESTL